MYKGSEVSTSLWDQWAKEKWRKVEEQIGSEKGGARSCRITQEKHLYFILSEVESHWGLWMVELDSKQVKEVKSGQILQY